MTKIAEQVAALVADKPCAVPAAQVQAIIDGRGRIEHLQALAEEFGMVLRLERAPKRESKRGE